MSPVWSTSFMSSTTWPRDLLRSDKQCSSEYWKECLDPSLPKIVISNPRLGAATLLALELIRPHHHHTNHGRQWHWQHQSLLMLDWQDCKSHEPGHCTLYFLPGSEPYLCFWTFRRIQPGLKEIAADLFIYLFVICLFILNLKANAMGWSKGRKGEEWAWRPQ